MPSRVSRGIGSLVREGRGGMFCTGVSRAVGEESSYQFDWSGKRKGSRGVIHKAAERPVCEGRNPHCSGREARANGRGRGGPRGRGCPRGGSEGLTLGCQKGAGAESRGRMKSRDGRGGANERGAGAGGLSLRCQVFR